MANGFYLRGREAFANAQINWPVDTIGVVLVDTAGGTGYTPDLNTHQYLSEIPAAARVATGALANRTANLGTLDADDTTLTGVSGDQSEGLAIFKDTGDPATSPLLIWLDQAQGTLPVTPNTGDINIVWNSSGIAVL